MSKSRDDFFTKDVCSWGQFLEALRILDDIDKENNSNNAMRKWIFRGQSSNWPLKTTLERKIKHYDIGLDKSKNIENKLIRDFRRRFIGSNHDMIIKDTLYCLALMQHYGAPTRLLDFNYSAYIAAFFALENGISTDNIPVVWCLNTEWCTHEAKNNSCNYLINKRNEDPRDEQTFKALYMRDTFPYKLVFPENPFLLNERLIIQQGVFLCPADISEPFEMNIKSLNGYGNPMNIVKFLFKMKNEAYIEAIMQLLKMNITRSSLFPGLQGFSESFNQRLVLFKD